MYMYCVLMLQGCCGFKVLAAKGCSEFERENCVSMRLICPGGVFRLGERELCVGKFKTFSSQGFSEFERECRVDVAKRLRRPGGEGFSDFWRENCEKMSLRDRVAKGFHSLRENYV